MKNNFDKKKHRAKILKPLKIGDQVQIIKTDHEKSWNILGNTTAWEWKIQNAKASEISVLVGDIYGMLVMNRSFKQEENFH